MRLQLLSATRPDLHEQPLRSGGRSRGHPGAVVQSLAGNGDNHRGRSQAHVHANGAGETKASMAAGRRSVKGVKRVNESVMNV